MNDPHVVALIYRIEHSASVNYDRAKPFVREEPAFWLKVKDERVRFEFKKHYATEVDAQEAIEDYIRNWEFDACLERNDPDYFRLKFDKSEIEDRKPTPGAHRVNAGQINWSINISSPSVTRGAASYPLPPSDVSLNLHIEAMYQHYVNYCQGPEGKLLSMAYFCLTVVENLAQPPMANNHKRRTSGKRLKAAQEYNIEEDVLNEIGRLVSTRGGPIEARKEEGSDSALTLTRPSYNIAVTECQIHLGYSSSDSILNPFSEAETDETILERQ